MGTSFAVVEPCQSANNSRQSAHSQPKINQSPQPQNHSKDEAHGTDQNPVSVKIISAPDAKAENPEEHERRVTHEANEQDIADFTRYLVYGTIGLVGVAAIQAVLFVWQLGYMRRGLIDAKVASDAAKEAARAASKSNQLVLDEQRPLVKIINIKVDGDIVIESCGYRFSVLVKIRNIGKSPARDIKFSAVADFFVLMGGAEISEHAMTRDCSVMVNSGAIQRRCVFQNDMDFLECAVYARGKSVEVAIAQQNILNLTIVGTISYAFQEQRRTVNFVCYMRRNVSFFNGRSIRFDGGRVLIEKTDSTINASPEVEFTGSVPPDAVIIDFGNRFDAD